MRAPAWIGVGVGVALALSLRSAGCAISPSPMLARDADVATCADCHPAAVQEWRGSAHARAWTAPAFVEASAGHTQQGCLGCHAPSALVVGEAPSVREWRREDGVDCQACHLDAEGRLVGPHESDSPALLQGHLVRRDALRFRGNELCGTCHEQTLAEVDAFGRAPDRDGLVPTCQQCHMQPVVRDLTQGGDVGTRVTAAANTASRQRRHRFELVIEGAAEGERFGLDVSLVRDGERLVAGASLRNGLPHALPTGNVFSTARVRLSLVALDARGEPTRRFEAVFAPPGAARGAEHELAAGDVHALAAGLVPPETRRLELTLTRTQRDRPDVVLAQQAATLAE